MQDSTVLTRLGKVYWVVPQTPPPPTHPWISRRLVYHFQQKVSQKSKNFHRFPCTFDKQGCRAQHPFCQTHLGPFRRSKLRLGGVRLLWRDKSARMTPVLARVRWQIGPRTPVFGRFHNIQQVAGPRRPVLGRCHIIRQVAVKFSPFQGIYRNTTPLAALCRDTPP